MRGVPRRCDAGKVANITEALPQGLRELRARELRRRRREERWRMFLSVARSYLMPLTLQIAIVVVAVCLGVKIALLLVRP